MSGHPRRMPHQMRCPRLFVEAWVMEALSVLGTKLEGGVVAFNDVKAGVW